MKKLGLIIFVVTTTLFVACDKKGSHGDNVCGNGYPVNSNYATTPAVPGTQPNPWAPTNPNYNNPNYYNQNCAGVYPTTGLSNFYPQNAQNSMTFQPQIPGCSGNLPIFSRQDMGSYCSWLTYQAKQICPSGPVDMAFQQACSIQVRPMMQGRQVICIPRDSSPAYPLEEAEIGVKHYGSSHSSGSDYVDHRPSTPSTSRPTTTTKPAPVSTPVAPAPAPVAKVVEKPTTPIKSADLKGCFNIQKIHDYIVDPTHGTSSLAVKYLRYPSVQNLSATDNKQIYNDAYRVPLFETSNHDIVRKSAFGNSVVQNGATLKIDDQVGTITQCDSNLRLMWVDFVDSTSGQKYSAKLSLLLGKNEKSKPNVDNHDPVANYYEGTVQVAIDVPVALPSGDKTFTTESYIYWSHNGNLSNVDSKSIDGKLYTNLRKVAAGNIGTKKANPDREAIKTFEGVEANTKAIIPDHVIIETK